MKTNSTKNRGIKMTKADVRSLIEEKKERLDKQKERMEKLEQTIANTSNDIEQLEYTLLQMERAEVRPRRIVPRQQVFDFFIHVSQVFDRLQRRRHRTLNYIWFCLALCARYSFEKNKTTHLLLSPVTVLGYFKRERNFVE